MPRILLIDDDPIITNSLRVLLADHGHTVRVVNQASDAPNGASDFQPDAILLDLEMPGRNGLDLLPELKLLCPRAEVVVYTGTGDIPKAVRAIKLGAYDFLVKAIEGDEVLLCLDRALETRRLREENARLREAYDAHLGPGAILVFSEKTRRTLELAERYRRTPDISVLIEGESGTGKELIARHVHYDEKDYSRPFVAINCGAIPRELVESELFGYVPGAFTGARSSGAPGKIQSADGGTLFLDEIGDLDLNSQVKFLRFLEQGTFYPVGGTQEKHVRLRVLCATNRDLEEAIAQGTFRRDLYYRINIGHIRIPPLRERREEILPFARHFLTEFSERFGTRFEDIHPAAQDILCSAPWPGNIRELRHTIERIVLIEQGPLVLPEHVASLHKGGSPEPPTVAEPAPAYGTGPAEAPLPDEGIDLEQTMHRLIERALERNNFNQSRTARYLNITREALRYRLGKGPHRASSPPRP
jgi:two-component system, NtrC family, response regulator AtoC